MTRTEPSLSALYTDDETAWLEVMAERIGAGDYADLDYAHLREYLSDMARRDRREVKSRLTVLLTHVLKWAHQPGHRSRSWRSSIIEHRQELAGLASHGVLRHHAEAVLGEAYSDAAERAAAETGLPADAFPAECEYTVDDLLAFEPINADQ